MKIWNQARSVLRNLWPGLGRNEAASADDQEHYRLAAGLNLQSLLQDSSIPAAIRAELDSEFRHIEEIARKLEQEEIHIAAFGRVGVGKSSLLNALLGHSSFSTSALHGETKGEHRANWNELESGQVILIDTPGIDELDGQQREKLAREVSDRADIVLMVCDADLTQLELEALKSLASRGRTLMLVLNKADRYSQSEQEQLLHRLRERTQGLIPAANIIACSSDPRPETVLQQAANGTETEHSRHKATDVEALRAQLWQLLEKDGKTLAVLNASLFTSELDQKIASRIVTVRKSLADSLIQKYCLVKGLAVAVNPVPVADLLAAAGTDIAMIIHLGEIYGFRLDKREASKLLWTISAQWIALMGAYWGVNLVSSALKTVSVGMSTVLTASAQGALAWYATYLTGKMAQDWFSRGKSWGAAGPREVARELLASLDRNEIIANSMNEIRRRLDSR
ncbi:MAG: GTP-binding protein [Xanthomonadales bacterium]|nr:GTP-binding protein [Xanthomonadales bacterium]